MEIFMTAPLSGIDAASVPSAPLLAFNEVRIEPCSPNNVHCARSLPGLSLLNKLKKCFKNWIDHLKEAKEEDLFGNKSDKF